MTAPFDPDKALLAAALRGDAGAGEDLVRALADLVWTACGRVTCGRADTETAFREVVAGLRANGFSRLEDYDGRARVRVYVALVVRDLLLERAVNLLVLDAGRGWPAFEAFFRHDMRRMIERALPGTGNSQNRDDAYQAVCEALLRNDFQRLRAYSGRGSLSGFVLHIIENLVIDFVRTIVPRRRLPAAIHRLPALEQAVFRLIYGERLAAEPALLLAQHLGRGGEARRRPRPRSRRRLPGSVRRFRPAIIPSHVAMATPSSFRPSRIRRRRSVPTISASRPRRRIRVESQAAHLLEQALDALKQVLPSSGRRTTIYAAERSRAALGARDRASALPAGRGRAQAAQAAVARRARRPGRGEKVAAVRLTRDRRIAVGQQ